MTEENEKKYKILIIGEASVGKTSIMCRYADNFFPENYKSTIGIDFRIKKINHKNDKFKIQILDTAGQERFRSIGNSYYREVRGIFIVFDLTDKDTFNQLDYWLQSINDVVDNQNIIILANKCDLKEEVTDDEINNYIIKTNYDIIKVSARKNININQAFKKMINLIKNHRDPERDSFMLKKKKTKKKKKQCC